MPGNKRKQTGAVARFGEVSIEIFRGTYRIRFRYKGERKQFTVGKVSEDSYKVAVDKALQIDRDLLYDQFDETLAKYRPQYTQVVKPVEKKQGDLNLRAIWQWYKDASVERVAATTQKTKWRETDNALDKLSKDALKFENPQKLLEELLWYYSPKNVEKRLTDINAACNRAVSLGLIASNPYAGLKKDLPKKTKTSKVSRKCFEPEDIKVIIKAFFDNEDCSPASAYSHSYYVYYVEFLALTGFRPEEAIALTWGDIKQQNGRTLITVEKAYSKGELKETKTYESRNFPCNSQLVELLKRIPKKQTPNNLIFPGVEGGYLHQGNFTRRHWRPVVMGLYKAGKISQYLPCYNLRHSFVTRLIRVNYDPATVAALAGNSPDVILRHYLAARKEGLELPEL